MFTKLYLELTPDERSLIEGTRRHLTDTTGTQLLRDREHEAALVDRAWWSTGCELGWTAPLVPAEWGGGSVTGTPMRELGLVAYEQGRRAAPGPLANANAAIAGLVLAAGAGWQAGTALERLVSGEKVVTWAGGDGGFRWAPFTTRVNVAVRDHELVLDGAGPQVDVGIAPDWILLSATAHGGPVQILVPADAPGVTLEPLTGLDLARRHARLILREVTLPRSALVGEGEQAAAQAERQFLVASALLAADSCGSLSTGFEMTMEWLAGRYTFGRPLASYQALKHRMADIRTHLEASYAVTTAALDALDREADDAAELVSVAQAYVGEHAPFMFSEFIQLHGGIGVTWEHDLHVHLRRVIANSALFGAPADHHHRLAALVLKGA